MRTTLKCRRYAGYLFLILMTTLAAPDRATWLRESRGEEGDKGVAASSSRPTASDARTPDRNNIRTAFESFAKTFDSGDAKALSSYWTADGEYENDSDVRIHGRAEIESSFADFFSNNPDAKAEVHPASLRFLSRDTAIGEGTVAVRRGPTQPAKPADYSALFVRDDGQWHLAQLREISPSDNPTVDDLSWLVGEWKSVIGEGAEIRTTYAWDGNKKFINVQFTLKEQKLNLSGRQIIGVDPATGGIRSWTFEANGGVAEADWQRDGDHWVLESDGTLSDGRTLKQTNVLRRINDDTITWQSVDRVLGDEKIPDLAPVKVTRITPK
jgi:uncharacterized protein (TIGR02246 family)